MSEVITEIRMLRSEIAALAAKIDELTGRSADLSIAEKAKIIREAHASGDRSRVRRAYKIVNGGGR